MRGLLLLHLLSTGLLLRVLPLTQCLFLLRLLLAPCLLLLGLLLTLRVLRGLLLLHLLATGLFLLILALAQGLVLLHLLLATRLLLLGLLLALLVLCRLLLLHLLSTGLLLLVLALAQGLFLLHLLLAPSLFLLRLLLLAHLVLGCLLLHQRLLLLLLGTRLLLQLLLLLRRLPCRRTGRRAAAIACVVVVVDVAHVVDHRGRARDIRAVVVDHRRPVGRWRRCRAVAPARRAPVHVPGVPAPAVALQRRADDHAAAEGQRAHRGHLATAVAGLDHHRRRCIGIAGVDGHGRVVNDLRVVARHVHHVGLHGLDGDELLGRFDHQGARVHRLHVGRGRVVGRRRGARHAQLVVVLEAAGLRCALAHHLDRVHHVGRVVVVGLAQRGGPRDVAGHLVHHGPERGERLHARVPRLLVGGIGERAGLERGVLLQPAVGRGDLIGVGGAGQDLRDELVGVQRNRRDQLVELLGRRRRVGSRHRRGDGRWCLGGRCFSGGRWWCGLVAACNEQRCDAQRSHEAPLKEGAVGRGCHLACPEDAGRVPGTPSTAGQSRR
ncbi:hypothetical protein D3C87_629720 [compost metagenome]